MRALIGNFVTDYHQFVITALWTINVYMSVVHISPIIKEVFML